MQKPENLHRTNDSDLGIAQGRTGLLHWDTLI